MLNEITGSDTEAVSVFFSLSLSNSWCCLYFSDLYPLRMCVVGEEILKIT